MSEFASDWSDDAVEEFLLTAAAIGGLNVVQVLREVVLILAPMLIILVLLAAFPDIILWLPQTVMPGAFR